MNIDRFQSERAAEWAQLTALVRRAGRRPERLGLDGLLELGRLYRAASADLAAARRRFPGHPLLGALEALVLSAQQIIYADGTREGSLRHFLVGDYWRQVAGHARLIAIAAAALFLPAAAAAAWAASDPHAALGLAPAGFAAAAAPHVHHLPSALAVRAESASAIFTNNITVTFMTFGGGLLLGLGTLLSLAYNGLLLGLLAGLTIQAKTFSTFISLVAPHGLLELSCIIVAGAAGLSLGRALVEPGLLPRSEALRLAARPAVLIVLGTAPWLIVAGLIEGLVTPDQLPAGQALAISGTAASTYWLLVIWRGRPLPRAGAATAERCSEPGASLGAQVSL